MKNILSLALASLGMALIFGFLTTLEPAVHASEAPIVEAMWPPVQEAVALAELSQGMMCNTEPPPLPVMPGVWCEGASAAIYSISGFPNFGPGYSFDANFEDAIIWDERCTHGISVVFGTPVPYPLPFEAEWAWIGKECAGCTVTEDLVCN